MEGANFCWRDLSLPGGSLCKRPLWDKTKLLL